MFRNLIPILADKYHVVAPDFPGYGESSAPASSWTSRFLASLHDAIMNTVSRFGKTYAKDDRKENQ
jgi:pimeloyl-ACP methyl ester carboxylesterase